jgi:RHS repeat-associated protein
MVSASFAQSNGSYSNGAFDSQGPEVVDIGNADIHYTIPVLHKPGRANTNFIYDLHYDNAIWASVTTGSTLVWAPSAMWGWSTPALFGYITYQTKTFSCLNENIPGNNRVYYTSQMNYRYVDSNNQSHAMIGAVYSPEVDQCGKNEVDGIGKSNDGSYITLDPDPNSSATAVVTLRDGSAVVPPVGASPSVASTTDLNGNTISTTGTSFTDTLGTTALTITGGAPSNLVYTYKDTTGANQTITISYSTYTIQTAFGCSGISEYGPTTAYLTNRITYPDSSYYQFSYEPTPGASANVTGRLSSVRLSTGGTIQYSYSGANNGINCSDGSALQIARVTSDGTRTYTRSSITATTSITDVATGVGDHRHYSFIVPPASTFPNEHFLTHSWKYTGPATSTALEENQFCFNSANSNCDTTVPTVPLTGFSVNTTLNGAMTKRMETVYDSYGQLSYTTQYDFGSGSVNGGVIQSTSYSMVGSTGKLLAVKTSTSAGLISQTDYAYDETAVVQTSGVPSHGGGAANRYNLTSITNVGPSGTVLNKISAVYNDTGTVASIGQNRSSTVASYGYDGTAQAFPVTVTNSITTSDGNSIFHATTATYDINTGLQKTAKGQNANDTVNYTYDAMLRPLTISDSSGLASIGYSFSVATGPSGAASIVQTGKHNSSSNVVIATTLDGYGRTQQVTITDSAGNDIQTNQYDADGRLHVATNLHRSGTSDTDGQVQYGYDGIDRLTSVLSPGASVASTTAFSGNTETVQDEAGKKRELFFDGLGRISEVMEPDNSNALTWETDYLYSQNYSSSAGTYQTILNQKGGSSSSADWRTRTFTYDMMGRLQQQLVPESGTTSYTYSSSTAGCSYDATLPCTITDNLLTVATASYDALGRIVSTMYSGGGNIGNNTPTVTYKYDEASFNGLTTSNGVGKMTGMTDGSGQTAWSYDALGRTTAVRKTIAGVTKQATYTYNLDGTVNTLQDFSGDTLTYGYNNAGQVTSIADTANSYATGALYYPTGQLHQLSHQAGTAAFQRTDVFNGRLMPSTLTASQTSSPTATLMSLSYGYAGASTNNGNIMSVTDNKNTGWTQNYTYDQLNRLQTANNPATGGTGWTQSYTYDPWGNMTGKSQTGSVAGTNVTATAASNRSNNNSYDGAGRVSNDGITMYSYDANGRILTAGSQTYAYDGNGARVKKVSGSTTTLYWPGASGGVIDESNGTGGNTAKQVYFGSLLVWRESAATGTGEFLFQDHLGSTRVAVSGAGAVQDNVSYYPFGAKPPYSTASSDNHYTFTGYEADGDTTDYAVYRNVQNNSLARFNAPDPYLGSYDFSNPQSLNRYTYVLNNPVMYVDPIGLDSCGPDDDSPCAVSTDADSNSDGFGGGGGGEQGVVVNGVITFYGNGNEGSTTVTATFDPIDQLSVSSYDQTISGGGVGGLNFAAVQRNPLDPQQCQSLANKINELLNKIADKQDRLNRNPGTPAFPGGLPLTAPGPRAGSVQGHQEELGEIIDNLAFVASKYNAGCGGGPPGAPNNGSSLAPKPVPIIVPPILLPMAAAEAAEGPTAAEILAEILTGLLVF